METKLTKDQLDEMIEKTMRESACIGCVSFYRGHIYMNGQINRGWMSYDYRIEYIKQTENENARYAVRLVDISHMHESYNYFSNLFSVDAPNVFDAYDMEKFFFSIEKDMIVSLAELKMEQYNKAIKANYL